MDYLPVAFCEAVLSQRTNNDLSHVNDLSSSIWSNSSAIYKERSESYVFILQREPGSNNLLWKLYFPYREGRSQHSPVKFADLNHNFDHIKQAAFYSEYNNFIRSDDWKIAKESEKVDILKHVWAFIKEQSDFYCVDEELKISFGERPPQGV
ncbi:hypothetical protein L596_020067 [Steinernema carpocapsae]|uniref:Uncharacterized protein n=1 Tax=Steinernema carpocapsae TaxID=34508 RepID=A0A4U5MT40_STECR|nr:hypothetical protein L596_020067 [Steinernema carpocapsae]